MACRSSPVTEKDKSDTGGLGARVLPRGGGAQPNQVYEDQKHRAAGAHLCRRCWKLNHNSPTVVPQRLAVLGPGA